MPHKVWGVGEEVLAADFQDYVQDQVTATFPNAATRDSEWLSPPAGALAVTTDDHVLWQRDATTWQRASGGVVGFVNVTTPQTGIDAVTTITGLALTRTVPTGRVIEVGARVQFAGTSGFTGDVQVLTELLGSGTVLQRHQTMYRGGASPAQRDVHTPSLLKLSDGLATTYTVRMQTVGVGVISTECAATYPLQLYVLDLGRAP